MMPNGNIDKIIRNAILNAKFSIIVICWFLRDLHWGNILVKNTKQKHSEFILNGAVHSTETRGVHVNIIDYSLSRLEIGESKANFYLYCISFLKLMCVNTLFLYLLFFFRWSDSVLWYLSRRGAVYGSGRLPVWNLSPDEKGKQVCASELGINIFLFEILKYGSHCSYSRCHRNCWSTYNPHSNVLWLHYLADKLLAMSYKAKAQSSQHKTLKSTLKSFHSEILNYTSATEALMHCKFFQWNV